MSKLKCWKKNIHTTFGDEWGLKSNSKKTVYILQDQAIGSPNSGLWFVKISGKGKHWEKTEKEALSFAQKYMKEHDTCRRDVIDPHIERNKETLELIRRRRRAEESFSKEFIKGHDC